MADPVDQVFLVRHQFRTAGRVWTINTHWRCTSGYDPDTSSTALEDALQPINDQVVLCISDSTSIEGTYITHVLPGTALPAKKSFPSTTGSVTGTNSLPPNCAAVLTIYTTDPDARSPGRVYLAGIGDSVLVDGKLQPAFVEGPLTDLGTELLKTITAQSQDFVLGIVQRQRDGSAVDPPVFLQAAAINPSTIIYSQRRRTSKQIGAGV